MQPLRARSLEARVVSAAPPQDPGRTARQRVDDLLNRYRSRTSQMLEPLVGSYNPIMLSGTRDEYRKMLELSTKMSLVGHACTEIAGYEYDARRQMIGSLFGACCFLADSFIDDFGDEATREYLHRLGLLLTEGWFDARTDREKLFYVIVSRLFAERDILDPTVRQAILFLFQAQKQDVELRLNANRGRETGHRRQLELLKQCARNRSGHAIIVLSAFLLPELPLRYLTLIFSAGALIMYIDDHGDCYSDLTHERATFMNQVRQPERALRQIFSSFIRRLSEGLPQNAGRDLLIAFLTRYYLTRVEKHRQQKVRVGHAWTVYE
jgi:hypothetical protein